MTIRDTQYVISDGDDGGGDGGYQVPPSSLRSVDVYGVVVLGRDEDTLPSRYPVRETSTVRGHSVEPPRRKGSLSRCRVRSRE